MQREWAMKRNESIKRKKSKSNGKQVKKLEREPIKKRQVEKKRR